MNATLLKYYPREAISEYGEPRGTSAAKPANTASLDAVVEACVWFGELAAAECCAGFVG